MADDWDPNSEFQSASPGCFFPGLAVPGYKPGLCAKASYTEQMTSSSWTKQSPPDETWSEQ